MITPPFLEMGQKKGLFKLQVKSQKSKVKSNQSNHAYTLYNHTYHLNPIQCYSFMLFIIATHQITYLQEIIASHKPVM